MEFLTLPEAEAKRQKAVESYTASVMTIWPKNSRPWTPARELKHGD